jgi:hypothetical protein
MSHPVINIFISFRCNYKYVNECLSSLYVQKNINRELIKLFIYDDLTPREDDSFEYKKYSKSINRFLSYFNYEYHYNVDNIAKYNLHGIYDMFSKINKNEIIAFLDGDDKLVGEYVLEKYIKEYEKENIKIVFGNPFPDISFNNVPTYSKFEYKDFLYQIVRNVKWFSYHMKTIKSDLILDHDYDIDLFKINGEPLIPIDQALFYEIIEKNKIDKHNISYIEDYNYYYRIYEGNKSESYIRKMQEQEIIIRNKQTDYYKKLNTNEHNK